MSRANDSSHCQLHVSRACSRTTARVAEETQRCLPRLSLAHTGCAVLRDLLFKMEAQFVLQLDIRGVAAEERVKEHPQSVLEAHELLNFPAPRD